MRRERTDDRAADAATTLTEWRRELWSRRRFLLRMAGGSVLALFARANLAAEPEPLGEARRWELLDAVQQHLFPSEPDSPGAREINALAYLRFVVDDQYARCRHARSLRASTCLRSCISASRLPMQR